MVIGRKEDLRKDYDTNFFAVLGIQYDIIPKK